MLVGVLSDIHVNLDNLEKALAEFCSRGIEDAALPVATSADRLVSLFA